MSVTHAGAFVHASEAELAAALERGLTTPLRAVGLALEGVARDLDSAHRARLEATTAALTGALREAEAVVELFARRPTREDSCTLRELAWGARAALPAPLRTRVWVATEPGEQSIRTDGPVLVRALAALVERAAANPAAEILLHAHQEDEEAHFAVVDDLEATDDVLTFEQRSSSPPTAGILLARADLARLGAEMHEHVSGPHRCVTVRLHAGGVR